MTPNPNSLEASRSTYSTLLGLKYISTMRLPKASYILSKEARFNSVGIDRDFLDEYAFRG